MKTFAIPIQKEDQWLDVNRSSVEIRRPRSEKMSPIWYPPIVAFHGTKVLPSACASVQEVAGYLVTVEISTSIPKFHLSQFDRQFSFLYLHDPVERHSQLDESITLSQVSTYVNSVKALY
jgi:hypothetical protein